MIYRKAHIPYITISNLPVPSVYTLIYMRMKTKKITLFTPVGNVGKKIAEEILSRGHKLKVVINNQKEFSLKHPNISIVNGNVHNNEEVYTCVKGSDLVIFVNELQKNHEGECFNATRSVLMGIKQAGIKFLIISGYGLKLMHEADSHEQEAWNAIEEEQVAALKLLKREPEISWRYFYIATEEIRTENGVLPENTNVTFSASSLGGFTSIEKYASTIMEEVEKAAPTEKYKKNSILSNTFHSNKIYNNLN